MSFLIECPNCGIREVYEFRSGGEITPRPRQSTDRKLWAKYYYFKNNVAGKQDEWWYHVTGCRSWLIGTRDTVTNKVSNTRLVEE